MNFAVDVYLALYALTQREPGGYATYTYIRKVAPQLCVCPSCGIDDFSHYAGCALEPQDI